MSDNYQHPCILKAGYLSLKRTALAPVKRYLILCAPLTVQDVQDVYHAVFKVDPAEGLDMKNLPWLGNVACAAVRGTPLLIMLNAETSTATPTFVQFSDIRAISDESQLRSACSFALHIDVKPYDYKFAAASSIEYQQWNAAFGQAMNILTDRTMGGIRDPQNHRHSEVSQASSNINNMLFDFEQMNAGGGDDRSSLRHNSSVRKSLPNSAPSVPIAVAGAAAGWGAATAATSASPPSSPIHPLSTRRQKVPTLPHHQAPPSVSRKYVLGQDRPQSPGVVSPGPNSPLPMAPPVHSANRESSTSSSPRNSTHSSYSRSDLPPTEIIDAPEQ
ncbi:hypothetical protein HKX48_008929 [Thoreauomyces humboldtii]|nr:hypothetical protein HKX48_008929 [Thoreauomyces humboldtii]